MVSVVVRLRVQSSLPINPPQMDGSASALHQCACEYSSGSKLLPELAVLILKASDLALQHPSVGVSEHPLVVPAVAVGFIETVLLKIPVADGKGALVLAFFCTRSL